MTPVAGEAQPARALRVTDLHLTLRDVAAILDAGWAIDATDAFLLAAGASQVARDAAEHDPASLRRAGAQLARSVPRGVRPLVTTGANVAARAIEVPLDVAGARRVLDDLATGLEHLTGQLAERVYAGTTDAAAVGRLRALLRRPAARWGRAAAQTTALPSCFRSFDLHPADLRALAARIRDPRDAPSQGYVVLGVRTSGCYLAPLLAAALRETGATAAWATVRPGRPAPASVRQLVEERANLGGLVVVVDDPPGTGGSLAAGAEAAVALGAPRDAVLLAYALHEGQGVPAALAGYAAAVLDWPEWDVHRRVGADAVARILADAGTGADAAALRPVELPPRVHPESHARAGYAVALRSGGDPVTIVAEGSGLGYLGRHTLAVAELLGGAVPPVLSFDDGVTVRVWLDDAARVALDGDRLAAAAEYAAVRRDALPALRDASATMTGRQPVWEVASRLLAAPYRELGLAVRAAGLDGAVRRLLAPDVPSVVDGQTGAGSWFEPAGALVKVAFAERAFSHLDLACYDAAYDLAGSVADAEDPAAIGAAVAAYEDAAHQTLDPERLLLYRHVHLWDRARVGQLAPDLAEAQMARAWQEWARDRLLGGPCDPGDGRWCVLDIDGVLETSRLGAPTLTPASAAALRALVAHGLRPLLATGRSLGELVDRCARYGLAGGTAEYGGVAYVHGDRRARSLLEPRDHETLEAVRARLAATPGVTLAAGPTTMVRAFRVAPGGRRRALEAALVDELRHDAAGRLSALVGRAQTDLVPYGVDKARGIAVALELLGEPGTPIALAVGDAEPDLGILRMADVAYVPSNGAHLARGPVVATREGFQRGLLEAVDAVVGHGAGPCERCAPLPPLPPGAALLAEVLRGLEGGRGAGVRAAPTILARAAAITRVDEPRPAAEPAVPPGRDRAAARTPAAASTSRRRTARDRRSSRGPRSW